MSQFRRGLNKNANNPQFRRSVKATSWKARNKTKRKQKRHIKLHERIMTSMRRTRGVPVGRFVEFPGYFDFWFTVFFSSSSSFATLSTFYAADLWAETWNDDPSPTATLSLPRSDLFTYSCSSFRCLGTFYGPAPAVSCSASAFASVLLDRANKLGISQLIYIKPNAGSFSSRFQPKR